MFDLFRKVLDVIDFMLREIDDLSIREGNEA
jgi:hypothetical protein